MPIGEKIYVVGTGNDIKAIVKALGYATGSKIYTKRSGRNRISITGFHSNNSRFSEVQNRLSDLIQSSENFRIKFDSQNSALLGGGSYENHTVSLDPKLKMKKHNSFYYIHYEKRGGTNNLLDRVSRSIAGALLGTGSHHKRDEVLFNLWDTLTHELIGHGHDDYSGKLRKFESRDAAEWSAIRITNKVRKLRGKKNRDSLK